MGSATKQALPERWQHLALLGNCTWTMMENGPVCRSMVAEELVEGIRELYAYFPEPENYQFDVGPSTPEEAVWEFLMVLEGFLGAAYGPKPSLEKS